MSKKIPLDNGMFAAVDEEDYEWAMRFKWHAVPHKNTFYAARYVITDGLVVTEYMHDLIMARSLGYEVDSGVQAWDGFN